MLTFWLIYFGKITDLGIWFGYRFNLVGLNICFWGHLDKKMNYNRHPILCDTGLVEHEVLVFCPHISSMNLASIWMIYFLTHLICCCDTYLLNLNLIILIFTWLYSLQHVWTLGIRFSCKEVVFIQFWKAEWVVSQCVALMPVLTEQCTFLNTTILHPCWRKHKYLYATKLNLHTNTTVVVLDHSICTYNARSWVIWMKQNRHE